MQTTNERMTEEQLTDLLNLAAELQAKAEASNDRDTAVMAYAVQKVCVELTESRLKSKASEQQLAAVVAENAGLKAVDTWMNADQVGGEAADKAIENGDSPEAATRAGIQAVIDSIKTPATDAFLAEVRASEAKHVYDSILDNPAVTGMGSLVDWLEQYAKDSASFAAQLRQGAAL